MHVQVSDLSTIKRAITKDIQAIKLKNNTLNANFIVFMALI